MSEDNNPADATPTSSGDNKPKPQPPVIEPDFDVITESWDPPKETRKEKG